MKRKEKGRRRVEAERLRRTLEHQAVKDMRRLVDRARGRGETMWPRPLSLRERRARR